MGGESCGAPEAGHGDVWQFYTKDAMDDALAVGV